MPAPGPLIFIATNRIRPGRLDAERARVAELVRFVDDHEPQLLGFHEYVNDEGTEATVVQIHPDAASMARHLSLIAGRASSAYADTLDGTLAIQVYGPIDPDALAAIAGQTGDGVRITLAAEHLGGFTRGRAPATPA